MLVDREFNGPLPPARVAQLRTLIDGAEWPRASVRFDRIASFGRHTTRPLVLTTDAPQPGLEALAKRLGERLDVAGAASRDDDAFRPHMTLLYDAALIAPQAVEPVEFIATGFDLVHSHIGAARYDRLVHWALPP